MTYRGRLKNQVHGLLGRLLIQSPHALLLTKKRRAWLKAIELPAHERVILDSLLRQLDALEAELLALDKVLAETARQLPQVPLLMTISGLNYVVAMGLLAALGDISRFPDGDHAAAYLGLAPSTRQSGNHCYHGHITSRATARFVGC